MNLRRVKGFKPVLPKCFPLFHLLVCFALLNSCELPVNNPIMTELPIMFIKTLIDVNGNLMMMMMMMMMMKSY